MWTTVNSFHQRQCTHIYVKLLSFLLDVEVIASVFAGHYVADVYNIGQQQWYHYDDEAVSCLTEGEVLGSARQRNGYIFCYMHRYHSAVSYLVILSPYTKYPCRAPLSAFVVSWNTECLCMFWKQKYLVLT